MKRTITKEEMAFLDKEVFNGQIHEIETLENVDEATAYLSGFKMLGFDTETRPSFQKGNTHSVSLVQLSTENTCFLFRVNKLGFPPSLIALLSNTEVLKIGLSLRDDFMSISRRMQFAPAGFIDLQKIVTQYEIEDSSLQKVYALLFNKKISKNQRLSNWDADRLTEAQKKYAALDAWACLKIYNELCRIPKSI